VSRFLNDEVVPVMPGLSTNRLERTATAALEVLCPEALQRPLVLPYLLWRDTALQAFGIHVVPVSQGELGPDRHAATDPRDPGDGSVDILLEQSIFDDLELDGPEAFFARSTFVHEIAHVILHVPVLRRHATLRAQIGELALARARRDEVKAFRDPEWQAWTLAGCIIAPRAMLTAAGSLDLPVLSSTFGVSQKLLRSHLGRLKMSVTYGSGAPM